MRGPGLLALAAALLVWAAAATAQVVTVRSGEHNGFSRLVLTLPAPANWRFGRTADGYELRIERPGLRFDVSSVFTYIPRDRLASVWTDPASGALRLGVRCACHAVAYSAQAAVVVVDIRDGPAVEGSGFERTIDDPGGAALPPLVAQAVPRPRPRPQSATVPASAAPAPTYPIYDWTRVDPAPAAPAPPPLPDSAAADLRARLSREVARAASSGLIEPLVTLPSIEPPPPDTARPPAADTDMPPVAEGNMRILPDGMAAPGTLTADGRPCIGDERLAFLSATPPLGPTDVADRRAQLVGEFDRVESDAARSLAEGYLAIGFGAEARAVADAFDLAPADAALVSALAAAIDGEVAPAGSPLTGMEVCDTGAALWAVLGMPDLGPGQPVAAGAVARAVSALPPPLRQVVGPRAADRLLAAGDAVTARTIRDALSRTGDGDAPPVALIDAGLSLRAGDRTAAEGRLREAASDGGPLAGVALARLADSVIDRGDRLDPPTLLALQAEARVRQGSVEGSIVARATARALAAAGDVPAAFAAADAAGGDAPAAVWAVIAAQGDDDSVLTYAIEPPPEAHAVDAPTRQAMAARLMALGFPDPARAWIGQPDMARDDAGALVAADAALQAGDARAALRALAGQSGQAAEATRAAALEAAGDPAGAVVAWDAAGQPDRAAATAWRQQDWRGVLDRAASAPTALPEGAVPLVASVVAQSAEAAPTAEPAQPAPVTLAGTRTQLAASADLRATLGALLTALPPE